MKESSDSLVRGRDVVRIEAKAVAALEERIGEDFERAVELIYECKGRVIVTGLGKSGAIGRKIAATLASTGTAALFLHAAEGLHGDLGIVVKDDLVLCVSKSGSTKEVVELLPRFKRLGVPVIAIVGHARSALASAADVVLDASVAEEACPLDLAPTASTTTALVMGDSLAVALLGKRKFTKEDFAMLHPGGNLGRQLLMRVSDVMYTDDAVPRVREDAPFKEALIEMNSRRFGSVCVLDEKGAVAGIITDGDLRRLLDNPDSENLMEKRAGDVMTYNPKTVGPDALAAEALRTLEEHNIMQLIVVNGAREPVGMVHLHDLLEAGIV